MDNANELRDAIAIRLESLMREKKLGRITLSKQMAEAKVPKLRRGQRRWACLNPTFRSYGMAQNHYNVELNRLLNPHIASGRPTQVEELDAALVFAYLKASTDPLYPQLYALPRPSTSDNSLDSAQL